MQRGKASSYILRIKAGLVGTKSVNDPPSIDLWYKMNAQPTPTPKNTASVIRPLKSGATNRLRYTVQGPGIFDLSFRKRALASEWMFKRLCRLRNVLCW